MDKLQRSLAVGLLLLNLVGTSLLLLLLAGAPLRAGGRTTLRELQPRKGGLPHGSRGLDSHPLAVSGKHSW